MRRTTFKLICFVIWTPENLRKTTYCSHNSHVVMESGSFAAHKMELRQRKPSLLEREHCYVNLIVSAGATPLCGSGGFASCSHGSMSLSLTTSIPQIKGDSRRRFNGGSGSSLLNTFCSCFHNFSGFFHLRFSLCMDFLLFQLSPIR